MQDREDLFSFFLRNTPLANFLHASDLSNLFGACRRTRAVRLSDCYVRVMDISGFKGGRLSEICRSMNTDVLPATLETLVCRGCPNMTEIDLALPDSLRYLELESCDRLESVRTPLPNSLRVYKCVRCEDLEAHPDPLPDGLHTFEHVSDAASYMGRLPEPLPSALVSLKCKGLNGGVIENVPREWPQNLRVLDLGRSSLFDRLCGLPMSLETLDLFMCDSMPALPHDLHTLTNLRSLDLTGCDEIQHIPYGSLPNNLVHLVCNEMYELVSLPRRLPPSLRTFECESCDRLERFPEQLPPTLQLFVFSNAKRQPPLLLPPIPVGTTAVDRSV